MNNEVNTLWLGRDLDKIAELSIKSYLANGINVNLWCYEEIKNIPNGTNVCDGSEILSKDLVYQHRTGQWYAPFSDWFRYVLLYKNGGWWSDLDLVWNKNEMPDEIPWFANQDRFTTAIGLLGFEKSSEILNTLSKLGEDPALIVPWDNDRAKRSKRRLGEKYPDLIERRENCEFGHIGPATFTQALKHYNLYDKTKDSSYIYPLSYSQYRKYFDCEGDLNDEKFSNAIGFHLWRGMLRGRCRKPHEDSIYAQLCKKYGVEI